MWNYSMAKWKWDRSGKYMFRGGIGPYKMVWTDVPNILLLQKDLLLNKQSFLLEIVDLIWNCSMAEWRSSGSEAGIIRGGTRLYKMIWIEVF